MGGQNMNQKINNENEKQKNSKKKNGVLIIDDNKLNRKILHRILENDYKIYEAENGLTGLNTYEEFSNSIVAIILDISMPVMDGFEFLREFAKCESSENVPVIVSTGQADKDNEIVALELGAWDFIAKPYEPKIIHFRLKNAILRSQLTAFQELKYKAEYDVLTGIYNKEMFFSETHNMLLAFKDEKFSMIRFDIDRFHLINSYFGITFGNQLLIYIAKALGDYVTNEYSVGTYGRIVADTFAFCIPTNDTVVLENVIHQFDKIVKKYDNSFDIVTTFGICIITDPTLSADTIYDRASLAAKTSKGNYVQNFAYYDELMDKKLALEQEITNDMNAAIEGEQFEIWYQPKYDIRINAPAGAEALVRWRHPTKGMISPGDFIPIFEHNGYISKLDYYVWEHVCMDMRRLADEGKKLDPISVNVSRVDLANPKLVDSIIALADKYQIPHKLLNLELTESAYTDNPEKMIQIMKHFQDNDFIILMDDFGSGYSSLSVLKDIDVNVLKIDMRFFSKTAVEGRSKSIIASVIRMAKWLQIPVVAEGVETKEQVEFLHGLGCEYIQGYYFSKPRPFNDYVEYMEDHRKNSTDENKTDSANDNLWNNNFEIADVKRPAAMFEYCAGNLQIIHVNNSYFDLFGYQNQDESFMNPLDTVLPEYRALILDTINTAIQTKEAMDIEYCVKTRDGSSMWISMKMKYLGHADNHYMFFGIFNDITDIKLLDHEFSTYLKTASELTDTGKLLIVDDIEVNRAVLKTIFDSKYEILEASNGEEALQVLEKENGKVDAILLDLIMPVMDGHTFLKVVKNESKFTNIPVIIITTEDNEQQQSEAIALGASDYIVKPFASDVVKKRVDNVLGLRSRLVTSFNRMRNSKKKRS